MDLFCCDKCNTVDVVELAYPEGPPAKGGEDWKCTACQEGQWHDRFPQEEYRPGFDQVVNRPNGIGMGSSTGVK